MSGSFDPYYDWLGIPPADQPPHHYRLLGLQVFESNPRVIENAADRLMTQLRGFGAGPNGKHSQKLLNEVAAARACLLDDAKRAAYDKPLRRKLADAAPQPQPPVSVQPVYVQVPVHVPVPVPVPVPTALPPMPSAAPAPPPPAEANEPPAWPATSQASFSFSTGGYRGRSSGGSGMGLAVAGIGAVAIAAVGGWTLLADPFGLFPQRPPVVAVNPTPTVVKVAPPTTPTPTTPTPKTIPASPATNRATPTETTEPAVTTPATTTTPPAETTPGPETPDPRPLPGTGQPTTPEPPMPPAESPPVESPAVELSAASAPSDSRHPQPPAEAQAAKLAELRELYQAEFDAGLKPAGREAFAEFLLATTDRLKSDPVARFVLLREAYTRFMLLKEFAVAAEVIDRLDAEFEMEPFKLRLHWLTEASPAAKLPAERLAVALLASDLAEQAVLRQRVGDADKLVRIAEGQAKNLNDSKLRTKTTAQRVEIERLDAAWSQAQKAREALAADPADAAAALVAGKYACLAEGDWKAGLELLARCSDAALAAAAAKDLAGPSDEISAAALGDQWYDIASGDKTLEHFFARARHWYQQQPARAADLEQARLQQRIEQIEALGLPPRLWDARMMAAANGPLPSFALAYSQAQSFEPVDLLPLVTRQDLMASPWGVTSELPLVLYSDGETSLGRLPVRYPPPREYQLTVRVRRGRPTPPRFGVPPRETRETGPFVIGLVGPKGPVLACFDLSAAGEFVSYLSIADATMPADNPTYRRLPRVQIPSSSRDEATIVCQVRRKSVTITIGGNEVCRYEGDMSKLTLPKEWSVGDPKLLFIGSHQCGYCVTGWMLEPLPIENSLPALPAAPQFGQP